MGIWALPQVVLSKADSEMVLKFKIFLRIGLCHRKGKKEHRAEGEEIWNAMLAEP